MRTMTQFGKRVFAAVRLIIAIAVVITLGIMVLGNGAHLLHINQQAFNVLAILCVLPICCMIIADAYCSIRDSKLA